MPGHLQVSQREPCSIFTSFKSIAADCLSSNQTEIVQTYVTYLRNASSIFLSRGARVVISPPTPTNPYKSGNYSWTPRIFTNYTRYIAESLGGPDAGIYFVDHSAYSAQALRLIGSETTNTGFPLPNDGTHTAPFLADIFARAFVLGLKCGTAPLQNYVVNATSRIEGSVQGTCLPVDDTSPI